jgi:hypothetical protein
MANTLTLTNASINSGTAVKILNGVVTYNWKNLVKANPTNSSYKNTEAVFTGWENPTFNLTFHIPVGAEPSGTMTWALWNQFVKNKYYASSGATKTTLTIIVGDSDVSFTDYSVDETTSGNTIIPIQILGFGLTFSPGESNKAGFWTINAQVMVTT